MKSWVHFILTFASWFIIRSNSYKKMLLISFIYYLSTFEKCLQKLPLSCFIEMKNCSYCAFFHAYLLFVHYLKVGIFISFEEMSTSFSKIKYNWKNDKQEKENVRNVFCQIQREYFSTFYRFSAYYVCEMPKHRLNIRCRKRQ